MCKLPQLQPDKVVRIVLEEGAVEMEPGIERPGDILFKHEDKTVLIFDETVSQGLENLMLDLSEEAGVPQLNLKPRKQ
jgi:hypothetical protein